MACYIYKLNTFENLNYWTSWMWEFDMLLWYLCQLMLASMCTNASMRGLDAGMVNWACTYTNLVLAHRTVMWAWSHMTHRLACGCAPKAQCLKSDVHKLVNLCVICTVSHIFDVIKHMIINHLQLFIISHIDFPWYICSIL